MPKPAPKKQKNISNKPLGKNRINPFMVAIFVAILVAAGVAIVYFSKAADSPYVPSGYTLKWSDEFNDTAIDTTKWNVANNSTYGSGNGELQCYMSSNVTESGGNAVLTGKPGTGGCAGYNYTSGWIATGTKATGGTEKYSFTQGYVEMRAKMPNGNIFWPALWLQGYNAGPSWPGYGEFDIGEWYPACPNMTTGTLHYDSGGHVQTSPDVYNVATGTANSKGGCASGLGATNSDFHIYGLEWTSTRLTWFVDGKVAFYFDGTNNTMNWFENGANQTRAFPKPTTDFWNNPHTISINMAMGGDGPSYYGWSPTNTIGSTTGDYLVDYIRVYQKDTTATGGTTTSGTTSGTTTGSTTGTTSGSTTTTPPSTVTTGDLLGRVVKSTDGRGVGQVYVTINYNGANHQVRTDGQGYYGFKGIPEGTYQVKFSKSKFATKYVTQSIVVGQTQTLNVALTPN